MWRCLFRTGVVHEPASSSVDRGYANPQSFGAYATCVCRACRPVRPIFSQMLALHVASWSKDRSTKGGAVIVGPDKIPRVIGYNGFPRGVNDDAEDRHGRPLKYRWTEHAERNAIYNAARIGVSLAGCIMYVPWFPCMDCARAIVQAGIVELVAIRPDLDHPIWGEDFQLALQLFDEAAIRVRRHATPAASEQLPVTAEQITPTE
jgi:dCMP deaminase